MWTCGRPVIAYKKGGALETVKDGITGLFFEEQTASSLKAAIEKFEMLDKEGQFKTDEIVKHAKTFSAERFRIQIKNAVYTLQAKKERGIF